MITAWMFWVPDPMALNGVSRASWRSPPLRLVSVPSSLSSASSPASWWSGFFFDRIRIDDPVGATAVHLAKGCSEPSHWAFSPTHRLPGRSGGQARLLLRRHGPARSTAPGNRADAVVVFALSMAFWFVTKLLSNGIRVSGRRRWKAWTTTHGTQSSQLPAG